VPLPALPPVLAVPAVVDDSGVDVGPEQATSQHAANAKNPFAVRRNVTTDRFM
jgi:hypothetical protein